MGKERAAAPPPKPAKVSKPRKKSGTGKWVQVNLRLAREEYNLFVTAAAERDMTAPMLAKTLVDDYMKGFAPHKVTSEPETE